MASSGLHREPLLHCSSLPRELRDIRRRLAQRPVHGASSRKRSPRREMRLTLAKIGFMDWRNAARRSTGSFVRSMVLLNCTTACGIPHNVQQSCHPDSAAHRIVLTPMATPMMNPSRLRPGRHKRAAGCALLRAPAAVGGGAGLGCGRLGREGEEGGRGERRIGHDRIVVPAHGKAERASSLGCIMRQETGLGSGNQSPPAPASKQRRSRRYCMYLHASNVDISPCYRQATRRKWLESAYVRPSQMRCRPIHQGCLCPMRRVLLHGPRSINVKLPAGGAGGCSLPRPSPPAVNQT